MNINSKKPVIQQGIKIQPTEITAAILHDRNVETKYLASKLEENDTYTKKVKEILEQKTL